MQGFAQGQRVTAAPWPTEEGEGTWQQHVLVPAKDLVTAYCRTRRCSTLNE